MSKIKDSITFNAKMGTILETFPAVFTLQTPIVIAITVVLEYVTHDEFAADLAADSELKVVTFLAVFLISPDRQKTS
jgi:cell division protein ZapA (FtsZ GTPase activity inhibitor)